MNVFNVATILALLSAATPSMAAEPQAVVVRGELTPLLILGTGYAYHDGYDGGWGAGIRYRMPLAPKGIIGPNASNIRDEFDLEFGGDVVTSNYSQAGNNFAWTSIRPRVGVMWVFWFTPTIALYPKLDLGYELGWYRGWDAPTGAPNWNGLFLEPCIGFIWRFHPTTSLRLEAGGEGLKVGVGFAF